MPIAPDVTPDSGADMHIEGALESQRIVVVTCEVGLSGEVVARGRKWHCVQGRKRSRDGKASGMDGGIDAAVDGVQRLRTSSQTGRKASLPSPKFDSTRDGRLRS